MIMPCYSFWDIKHDNEWGRTHNAIENYPLGEVCARSMSRQYGMAASWHTQADWVSDPETGGDDLAALLLLHDIMGRAENMANRTLPAKTLFGLGGKDVEFMGYWTLQPENDPQAKNVKASAWLRRSEGTALVVVANLDAKDRRETIRLPLERMGVRRPAVVCDGEERRTSIPLDGDAVSLAVPARDFRLLLVGPPGRFPADLPAPGAALDLPSAPARELCDAFDGPLDPAWKLVSAKESGGRIRTYRGRLMVLGSDYRFAAAERPFGLENATVGVRVETRGRAHQNWVGLALMWENGSFVFAGPHLNKGQFLAAARSGGKTATTWGGPVGLDAPEAMHQPNWVRVDLAPGTVSFWSSADGAAWRKDSEIPRTADLRGAPAALRLGKSPTGAEAVHRPAPTPCFFDDLRVGRL